MTEEMKEEFHECKCKKHLKNFLMTTAAVFTGTSLAILMCSAILMPKCPCQNKMMQPAMGRPLPPPMAMQGDFYHGKHHKKHPNKSYQKHINANHVFDDEMPPKHN